MLHKLVQEDHRNKHATMLCLMLSRNAHVNKTCSCITAGPLPLSLQAEAAWAP
jgi:hypothetical protein